MRLNTPIRGVHGHTTLVLVVSIRNARPWMSLERFPVCEVLFVVCLFGEQVEARGPMHGLSPAKAQRKGPLPYMVIRREYEGAKITTP